MDLRKLLEYIREHRKLTWASVIAIAGAVASFLLWGSLEHKLLEWTSRYMQEGLRSLMDPLIKLVHDGFAFGVAHPFMAAFNMAGAFSICLVVSAFIPSRRNPAPRRLSKTYWDAPFYFGVDNVGRRIESAVFGGNDLAHRADVKDKLESLGPDGEIPVNEYALCDGHDPADGRDKFMTVTFSETVRHSAVYQSPSRWLKGSSNMNTDNAPQLLIDYQIENGKELVTLKNDHPSETLRSWHLSSVVVVSEKSFTSPYGNTNIEAKNHRMQEFSFEGNMTLADFVRSLAPSHKSKITAKVFYENLKGQGFTREFEIVLFPNGEVRWQPGKIRPRE